jgi:hypothetical protein
VFNQQCQSTKTGILKLPLGKVKWPKKIPNNFFLLFFWFTLSETMEANKEG